MAIEQVAEQVAEEVATNLEEVADATRRINAMGISYFAVGLGIGAVVGFYFGHKFNTAKIKAEAFKETEEEISQLRAIYLQKTIAAENTDKPSVEAIVEQRGYSVGADAPQPPQRPLKAPVPTNEVMRRPAPAAEPQQTEIQVEHKDEWDYATELQNRSPDAPYVIHQNEYKNSNPEYSKVVYTYWAVDDVVTDTEDNHPITHGDIVVGLDNLKFGHGTDDVDVVYVRNDRLETDMEICRVHQSFEEEILGYSRNDGDDHNHNPNA